MVSIPPKEAAARERLAHFQAADRAHDHQKTPQTIECYDQALLQLSFWMVQDLGRAFAEIDQLRTALEHYANLEDVDHEMQATTDLGAIARRALGLPTPHHWRLHRALSDVCLPYHAWTLWSGDPGPGVTRPLNLWLANREQEPNLRRDLGSVGLAVLHELELSNGILELTVNFAEESSV